jgi:spore coat polysaccharide biosynthesis predicted glycosyltransferase SpsG
VSCRFVPLPHELRVDDDVAHVTRLVAELGAQFCIMDMANPEATHDLAAYGGYLQRCAEVCQLVILDDLTRAVFPRSIVVNPNTEVLREAYDTHLDPTILFGPSYAILRAWYRGLAATKTYTTGALRRVAISLGGGVVASELLAIVLGGIKEAFGTELEIELVTGFGDATRLRETGALDGFTRVEVLSNLPSLREVLLRADVAIVSGGVTKYEAAACGTPMVIVPSIDHQESWGASFARSGSAYYGGDLATITASSLAAVCAPLCDADIRRELGQRAATVIDARGPDRIVDVALATTLV